MEEVSCSAESLTVVLNRSDPDVIAWVTDPNSQPVVSTLLLLTAHRIDLPFHRKFQLYVYDHKTRRECGTSLKNENGEINYNLSIPYGKICDVQLADIVGTSFSSRQMKFQEPNYRTAETTVVLEDNADQSHMKSPRINHVFCLYTRKIQTIRFNEVTT